MKEDEIDTKKTKAISIILIISMVFLAILYYLNKGTAFASSIAYYGLFLIYFSVVYSLSIITLALIKIFEVEK